MSELQYIETTLSGAARRQRWARALRGLWIGLLIGASLSLLLAGAYRVWPLPLWILLLASLIPLPCMALGLLVGYWRKPALAKVAMWVDHREHLKDRLSTALEVAAEPESDAWGQMIVAKAAEHARKVDVRKLIPFTLPPRIIRWALIVLALGVGLGFVPEYRSKTYLRKQSDQAAIKEAGQRLSELTKRTLERRAPATEVVQKSLDSVGELANTLTKANLTRGEALKDIANAADRLKDELKEMGRDPDFKRLEQSARSSSDSGSQSASALQKEIESKQKQLGTPTGNPDAIEKMKKDLEKVQEAAASMNSKNGLGDDANKQKLSQALSALSQQAQDMGLQVPELDEAIQALAQSQTDLFLKDLHSAVVDLEKLRDMAKTLQQLQQQAEKMGKDLAEQLKNGQPEAAQATLQKMANALRSSGLPPEQIQKIAQEVAKAVQPAGNYGKVGDQLKQAGQKMQAGDKTGAAQALANAAKELGQLAQQMGDADSLQASLDALNQASAMIGSGDGWRGGYGQGGKPGSGKTQKYGRGVGDWADDSAKWDGTVTEHWDNSGIVRPDKDGRGHTDRGEGELTDALKPTKVRGQLAPGAQMPSVTLRNVSIKGTSRVDYEAAAAAAQSDAQSALTHEQVPRAYQGAVKDYFDDLPKN